MMELLPVVTSRVAGNWALCKSHSRLGWQSSKQNILPVISFLGSQFVHPSSLSWEIDSVLFPF